MIKSLVKALLILKDYHSFLLISSLLWIVLSLGLNIYLQYQDSLENFQESTHNLELTMLEREHHSTTLLQGIAQHYSTKQIKSEQEFSQFAEGILPDHPMLEVIGLAHLTPKDQITELEQMMHRKGFESFRVREKNIFSNTKENTKNSVLAVINTLPMVPANAVLLGQDLFSIPEIERTFVSLMHSNRDNTTWQRSQLHNHLHQIVFQPIYYSDPHTLKPNIRAQQTVGAVFLMINYEKLLAKLIEKYSHHQWSQVTFSHQSLNQDTKDLLYLNDVNPMDHIATFESVIQASNIRKDAQIEILFHWGLNNVDSVEMGEFLAYSMLLYILLIFAAAIWIDYAHSLQQMHNRMDEILTTSHDAVIITDSHGHIQIWNPEAEKMFGYKASQVQGKELVEMVFNHTSGDNATEAERRMLELFRNPQDLVLQTSSPKKVEMSMHTRSGFTMLVEVTYTILSLYKDHEISLFIKDITSQRKNEEEITQLAYYDVLTSLENRVYFKREVEHFSRYQQTPFTLMFIDLDGFKQVNDSLGHSTGDELLKVIARRLTNTLRGRGRGETHICRFGGDEFVLMVENTNEDDLSSIALRILNQVELPVHIGKDEMRVSGSIGIASYPAHGKDVDTLLRHADMAMYQAKDSGKNTFVFYNEQMGESLSQRLLIEKHLRNAIVKNEFRLVYQPQLDLVSGQVIGVEALIRWHNPLLGNVRPDLFINIAEESRIIIAIGDWVIEQCIEQLKAWRDTEFQDIHIAFNASSVQFEHPQFMQKITHEVHVAGIDPKLLEIELTERTVMGNADENIERFNEIRSRGIGLSVDDFGTGYSSLSYLKRFPLSVLKIDKSFVDGLPYEEEDISITRAIINLAQSLNMQVVAEGVETLDQLHYLKDIKCDMAQGYFISYPLPTHELEDWLKEHQHNYYHSSSYIDAVQKAKKHHD